MLKLKDIRKDLKEIKYYYSRKMSFDGASTNVGSNSVLEKIEKYNKIIRNASPRLYDLYVTLYIGNETQKTLADKLGFSAEYICRLNQQLLKFFLKEFEKEKTLENL